MLMNVLDPALPLEDDMQVQCLDKPQWTCRKVPKVSSFRSFERIPSWRRMPQPFTYHVCAEDLTKTVIVPNLPDGDLQRLEKEGTLPPESSARNRYCVMCPVRRVHRGSFHVVCVRIGVT